MSTQFERDTLTSPVNVNPIWRSVPTATDTARVFPAKASGKAQAGQVALQCRVNAVGALKNCDLIQEIPQGLGFADAARRLTPLFQADMSTGHTSQGLVNLHFTLVDPLSSAWKERRLTRPRWKAVANTEGAAIYPAKAADAHVEKGQARVRCVANAGGELKDCAVLDETPPGLGFGASAVAVASAFVVNPWTDDGLPVDQLSLTLPVVLTAPGAEQEK
jgi:hypothetical protein